MWQNDVIIIKLKKSKLSPIAICSHHGILHFLSSVVHAVCRLVDCVAAKCMHEAEPAMRAFMGSVFCLQPRGDTQTRRSTFDAIIAGCIPVFFNKDGAYTQYTWHLPSDGEKDNEGYSVYIPRTTWSPMRRSLSEC